MDFFKHGSFILLLLLHSIDFNYSTCVIETDFGFTFNCNFKKSGLFRVRNLGGVKSYVSLGFSLGDELGFPESISNIEGNRRRALNVNTAGVGVRTVAEDIGKVQHSLPKAIISPEQMIEDQSLKALKQQEDAAVPEFQPLPGRRSINSEPSRKDEIKENNSGSNNVESKIQNHLLEELSVNIVDKEDISSKNLISTTITNNDSDENEPASYKNERKPLNNFNSRRIELKGVIKRHHVMNAPKEYYPANYDKNFDDNFDSKIDLPVTSFHCGDQKHFPGLYSDIELNCMVFHVCALTDEGLIMKSFLCPESTVFDQSILKCNWWFYTDCKNSKSLYDSNLPVAKSYQLLKSLFYFNNHYGNKPNKLNNKPQIDKFNSKHTFTPLNMTIGL